MDTFVINTDGRIRAAVSWMRAVSMILRDEPVAFAIKYHPTRVIRSAGGLEVRLPTLIMLSRYHLDVSFSDDELQGAKTACNHKVIKRDKGRCAYCGKAGATTVDHVFPKSRGGKNTWENLVACCMECNNSKDDRTPEEAGLRLLYPARRYDEWAEHQEQVYKDLAEAPGAFV